jgi:hypothetical protein
MTEDGGKRSPFPGFQAYMVKSVVWHGVDAQTSDIVRKGVKWFFDLIRNAVIAGVLSYLATKSNSVVLEILSGVASTALLVYCMSYFQTWHLSFFHPWTPARWARGLDIVANLVVILPLFYTVVYAVPTAIHEIAKAQGTIPSTSSPPQPTPK